MTNTSSNDDVRRMIILDRGTDSELGIVGLGYSPDNGEHFFVTNTINGRVFRQRDIDMLWPLLVDKIKSTMSLVWDDIQGKPTLVTKVELDQRLAKLNIPATMSWDQITGKPDFDSELNAVKTTADSALSNAEKAQSTAEANQTTLTSKANQADLEQVKAKVAKAQQTADQAAEVANAAKATIDASSININKQPSEYPDGFSYELKSLNVLGIDRSQSHSSVKAGDLGLLTTKAVSYNGSKFVRQTLEQLDNVRPLNYVRNGMDNNWSAWEANTNW
ncbi:hypothetical protein [Limosilactobacillus caecicola]|uniref:hypothetical protein n=1 Tax=Limosilactobacillus caecicola TaxID=2941332 RepID=UPI00203C91F2|nr:hypothetical protein [Limosilactobacillus caecicola]